MSRRALPPLLILLLGTGPSAAAGAGPSAGYTFHRIVVWADPGSPPPRLRQDPDSREFVLLLPGPVPESGWDPVPARRYIARNGLFAEVDPLPILRPRDPDPDWGLGGTEASLDLNRDGRVEILRARDVFIPDGRDPFGGDERVFVEITEGSRVFFGDLLEGPDSGSVGVNSVTVLDFTGEGYTDLLVRLEGAARDGIALYSQSPLRFPGTVSRVIPGISPAAFRSDRYGIFDLKLGSAEFFRRLPASARPENPACISGPVAGAPKSRRSCRVLFSAPYLGWIQEFRIEFVPGGEIRSFDLIFPPLSPPTPDQALEFLTPVLGSGYRIETVGDGEASIRIWKWSSKGSRTVLVTRVIQGREVAVNLGIERNE